MCRINAELLDDRMLIHIDIHGTDGPQGPADFQPLGTDIAWKSLDADGRLFGFVIEFTESTDLINLGKEVAAVLNEHLDSVTSVQVIRAIRRFVDSLQAMSANLEAA